MRADSVELLAPLGTASTTSSTASFVVGFVSNDAVFSQLVEFIRIDPTQRRQHIIGVLP